MADNRYLELKQLNLHTVPTVKFCEIHAAQCQNKKMPTGLYDENF